MTQRQPLANCPLCAEILGTGGYRRLKGYEKDHLVKCRACGFAFSLLQPNAEDYERVYGNYDYVAEDNARTPLSIEKERAIVERLMKYRSTGKVLDVAAGGGRFLERFAERGFECHATEFNEAMCDYLTAKGFTAYRGGLFPEGVPEEAFDIVVFTEIIEHINNPLPVLEGLVRLLRRGGALFMTTPNFASIERRMMGPNWGMLMFPEHITYWTPRHLDRALRSVGLGKSSLRTQNISPYRIIQSLKKGRMSSMVSGVSEQGFSDAAQARVAGSRLLRAAKGAVNGALRLTGTGSSIEAVYEKKSRR